MLVNDHLMKYNQLNIHKNILWLQTNDYRYAIPHKR